jgi:hypothetical protein
VRAAPVACPSCAYLIDPAPVRSRLCPYCRNRVVVRRFEGRLVYLAEAAVVAFEAERRRESDERAWTIARSRWLRLAATVEAPAARIEKLATAPISSATVDAARALYATAADHAAIAARREKHWGELGRIRGEQVAALYADAGSPVPPPADLVRLYRDGRSAVLRSLAPWAPDAELVGAGCCSACRQDDGKAFPVVTELRKPRLPHEGCPKGLCACDWWIAVVDHTPSRRARPGSRRATNPGMPAPAADGSPGLEPPSEAAAGPAKDGAAEAE